jgi:crotonobetainyl-CoA:carnitine CoA-transferase CaiB-like acyl-CoA transferase
MAALASRNALVARLNVARAAALQQARRTGRASYVEVVPERGACAACQQLAARVFPFGEVLAKPPLPCAACTTRPGGGASVCRCTYRFHESDPRE